MKTLILGIGNSILCDDGIGPAVVHELKKRIRRPDIVCETTSLAGMPLLDIVTGYDSMIVIDAIQSGLTPGEIRWLGTEDFHTPVTECSEHKMGILRVLELGNILGIAVPENVHIMAIEANDVTSFIEGLTPEVAGAIPKAIALIEQKMEITGDNNASEACRNTKSRGQAVKSK